MPVNNNAVAVENAPPPPPPPPPQNNVDTGDLLVIYNFLFGYSLGYFSCTFSSHFLLSQGLSHSSPDALAIEENNALALAIVPTEPGKL